MEKLTARQIQVSILDRLRKLRKNSVDPTYQPKIVFVSLELFKTLAQQSFERTAEGKPIVYFMRIKVMFCEQLLNEEIYFSHE